MKKSLIRIANSGDLLPIKQIIDAVELFPSEYLDDMFSADSSPGSGEEFWLVFDDNVVHAVAYCAPERMTNGTWNLLLLAVMPEKQNAGIGRQLMSYVEETLRHHGARVLLVDTSGVDDFSATRHFYSAIGYEKEACIREYYDAGDDKITFRKAL